MRLGKPIAVAEQLEKFALGQPVAGGPQQAHYMSDEAGTLELVVAFPPREDQLVECRNISSSKKFSDPLGQGVMVAVEPQLFEQGTQE